MSKIKSLLSRGIALVHSAQGGPANKRPTALLMKSDIDPQNLTTEIVKSLEQVQLTISMEQFLKRFFYMYERDAELLTKVLGFQTELEARAEDEDIEEWEAKWIKEHQEYLDEKLESIQILKRAKAGEELSLKEQFDTIEIRKSFEEGCASLNVSFEDAPIVTEVAKPEVKETTLVIPTESSIGAEVQQTEESPVEVEVKKSAEYLALEAKFAEQMEIIKAYGEKLQYAEEIIKAEKAAKRAVTINKAKEFAFVEEAHVEAVADILESEVHKSLVSVIEKASEMLKSKDAELVAKDKEIEEIKKSFASGVPVGAEGELTAQATGLEDAQEALNRKIEAYKAATSKPAQ